MPKEVDEVWLCRIALWKAFPATVNTKGEEAASRAEEPEAKKQVSGGRLGEVSAVGGMV